LVYWTVYYIGLIILLPWNILITVNGYWDYKFRNVTAGADDGTLSANQTTELQKVGLEPILRLLNIQLYLTTAS
jgi:hypothetical protein